MKAATKSYKSFNTLKQYFTLKSTDYWHLQYPLNNSWEEYYWDMSEKAFQCELDRDKNGITTYIGEDRNKYYSSIELVQYAMASYQAFLKTGDLHWKNECIIHIDYYLSLAVSYKKSDYTVLNLYPISLYDINYKWPSALSLGVALSLMVRLYENFGLKKYLSSAENLLTNFFLEVKDGGVQRKYRIDKNQSIVILEEYPSSQLSGVLNGHISGLWGLYDLGRHIERSNQLFIELSNQLADNLNLWDGNYWSLYDINYLVKNKKNYASIHYHMLHIKQLFVMYLITNNRRYAEFSEKFIANKYGIISRLKAFLNKVFFRLT